MKAAGFPQAWLHQSQEMALPSAASQASTSHREVPPTALQYLLIAIFVVLLQNARHFRASQHHSL